MHIDLLSLVEQDGFRAVRTSTSRGGQYNGPCPFCGGTDRFRVQPSHGNYGWFACTQCEHKGSAVDYLMQKRGLSKYEALLSVGWTPKNGQSPESLSVLPPHVHHERLRWDAPPEQWQEAATDFYQTCQHLLWSACGKHALAYLRQRSLSDKTIKAALLGYHPSETYGLARQWGKTVLLPRGITIPWFFAQKVWRITVRDERASTNEERYKQIAGGSNGLYLADFLKKKRPAVVLTEGEFDALSLVQECRDLVAVVATGTTQGSHTPRWISLLAQQKRVLVAFDAEETGDHAARWWLQRIENAQRLRPLWKDANQMLQDGANLRAWIVSNLPDEGISSSVAQQQPVSSSSHPLLPPLPDPSAIPASFRERPCRRCGGYDARQTEDGLWLCTCYWTWYAAPSQSSCKG